MEKVLKIVVPAIFFGLLAAAPVHAAELYLSPSAANEGFNQHFTVTLYVDSTDTAMNAAAATLNFPADKIQVDSISTGDSIVGIWVQPPVFSNADGVVDLQGVVVNPGFQGSAGTIATITFHGIAPGSAQVNFSSGAVLANDGKGTNILTGMRSASFAVGGSGKNSGAGTSPPPFTITELQGDPTDPQPSFQWHATGAVKYLIKIGDGDWFNGAAIRVASSAGDIYRLPLQAPGENIPLSVDAYDGAGNMREASTAFSVFPIPTPRITSYSKDAGSPSTIKLQGVAPQNSRVQIYLRNQATGDVIPISATADESGNWLVSEAVKLDPGNWTLTAQAVDSRGAISFSTDVADAASGNTSQNIALDIVGWIAIVIAIALFMLVVPTAFYFLNRRFRVWKRSINKNLDQLRDKLRDDLERVDMEIGASKGGAVGGPGMELLERQRENIRQEIRQVEEAIEKEG